MAHELPDSHLTISTDPSRLDLETVHGKRIEIAGVSNALLTPAERAEGAEERALDVGLGRGHALGDLRGHGIGLRGAAADGHQGLESGVEEHEGDELRMAVDLLWAGQLEAHGLAS